MYHLLDFEMADKKPHSLLRVARSSFEQALSSDCASSATSMLCNSFFRECKAVEDESTGGPLWLPSLLCKSECEKHLFTWKSCVNKIEARGENSKAEFENAMFDAVIIDSTKCIIQT
jgi:hypothetical protein